MKTRDIEKTCALFPLFLTSFSEMVPGLVGEKGNGGTRKTGQKNNEIKNRKKGGEEGTND